MSKISKFFKGGGSAASKGRGGPSPQEALARLRETEEMLSKKQEYLETRIERELAIARQHGTKNKRGECGPGPARLNPGAAAPGVRGLGSRRGCGRAGSPGSAGALWFGCGLRVRITTPQAGWWLWVY